LEAASNLGGLLGKPDPPSISASHGLEATSNSRSKVAKKNAMFADSHANAAGMAANGQGVVAGPALAAGVGNPRINQVPSLNDENQHEDSDDDESHPEAGANPPDDGPEDQKAAEDGHENGRGRGADLARPTALLLGLREAERSERSILCMVAVIPIAILVAVLCGAPIPIHMPGLSEEVADGLCVAAGAAIFMCLYLPRYMPVTYPLLRSHAWDGVAAIWVRFERLFLGVARWGWSMLAFPSLRTMYFIGGFVAILAALVVIDCFAF
jgi:hypothetical protein